MQDWHFFLIVIGIVLFFDFLSWSPSPRQSSRRPVIDDSSSRDRLRIAAAKGDSAAWGRALRDHLDAEYEATRQAMGTVDARSKVTYSQRVAYWEKVARLEHELFPDNPETWTHAYNDNEVPAGTCATCTPEPPVSERMFRTAAGIDVPLVPQKDYTPDCWCAGCRRRRATY